MPGILASRPIRSMRTIAAASSPPGVRRNCGSRPRKSSVPIPCAGFHSAVPAAKRCGTRCCRAPSALPAEDRLVPGLTVEGPFHRSNKSASSCSVPRSGRIIAHRRVEALVFCGTGSVESCDPVVAGADWPCLWEKARRRSRSGLDRIGQVLSEERRYVLGSKVNGGWQATCCW